MLRKNRYFFIPYFIFLIVGFVLVNSFTKGEIHITINQYHNSFSDIFFKYATFIGEGLFASLVILVLAFYRFRDSLLVLSAIILSSIIAQFLKKIVFSDIVRPKAYFEGVSKLHFVEGVEVHSLFSFPSGHATLSFTLLACMAFIVKNNGIKTMLLILAIIASWSRIHLSQHFFIDVYFGSLLGVSCSLLTFWFFEYKVNTVNGLNKSLKAYIVKHKE
ncbi:MAG: phosphatase PAP2 family protein [Bacteroidetes bacterium]|nr:phosphatase PAP2 family protein [Bacteroidota bacterium]HET6243642.1 phosphatase PAP2 family protein [Bacteroidia bacterium]